MAVILASYSVGEAQDTPATVRPAKLIELTAGSDVRTVSFPAIIEASVSSQLTFQVGGLILELAVREGQLVEQGSTIARLDQRNFRNELATAEAQYDNANAEFQRAERLIAENAIARNIFDQRKSQRVVALAALDRARKALDDTVLEAPFSGVVASVHTEQFQNVQPLEPIITLQSTDVANAAVQVPASLIATSRRFETLETVVMLDVAPEVRIPAVFQSSTTQADVDTQTFLVQFVFTPPDDLIVLPGMTGIVESRSKPLTTDGNGSTARIRIPLSTILSDGVARYVWVIDKQTMTASRREVVLGAGVGETLLVLEGLEAGEVIVGAGASYLHEGMTIRPFVP